MFWVSACVCLIANGCTQRTTEQVRQLERTDTPLRIVVLSPALAAVLVDLGYQQAIVGRHGYDRVLDKSIPVCGDQGSIDYEALLRARPTVVMTEWGSRSLPQRLVTLAEKYHWKLLDVSMLSLDDVASAVRQVQAELGPAEQVLGDRAEPISPRVERFVSLVDALHDVEREPQGTPMSVHNPLRWSGRVLLLMGTEPIEALGPGSAHAQLLEAVGGVDAIEQGSPYMVLHQEDVLRLKPDAMIVLRSAALRDARRGEDTDAALFEPLAGLDIPAVREGRLAVIDSPLGLLPSTALADVADAFVRLLDGWAAQNAGVNSDP